MNLGIKIIIITKKNVHLYTIVFKILLLLKTSKFV